VVALRGANGGWKLDEDWRTEVPGLDESELRALLMAQPQVVGDARLVHAAERALSKLMAALPGSLRAKAASIRQRLHVDTTRWSGAIENLAMLPLVQDAVARDRKLRIRYRPPGHEPADRTVDPLGLVAKGSTWYLVAGTPRGLRTYRVSRIQQAELLDEPTDRPEDFDLAAYWSASTAEFRDRPRYTAILRLGPAAAERLKAWGIVGESPPGAADAEGWVTAEARFDDEDDACFIVLGVGPEAEVVRPPALAERIAADVRRMFVRRPGPRRAPIPRG
jgi:predicted DNA-binding transcriptional regulator YafY